MFAMDIYMFINWITKLSNHYSMCALISSMLLVVSASARIYHCPAQNDSITGLQWSGDSPASLTVECKDRYHELLCCAQAYGIITWWQRSNSSKEWKPVHVTQNRYIDTKSVGFENQTLIFKRVSSKDAAYEYKCVVTGLNDHVIQQEIEIRLYDCNTLNGAPIFIEPLNANQTIRAHTGSDVNMTCVVFFGDVNEGRSGGIIWMRVDPFELIEPLKGRVHYEETTRISGNALESVMVIESITKSDYGFYQCQAFNGFIEQPIRQFHIEYKPRPIAQWQKNTYVTIITLTAIVIIVTLIVLLLWRNHLSLRMQYHRWKSRRSPINDEIEETRRFLNGGHWVKNKVDLHGHIWTVRFADSHKEIVITVSSGIIKANGEWTGWTCNSPWIQIDFEKKMKIAGIVIGKGSSVTRYTLFRDCHGNFIDKQIQVDQEFQYNPHQKQEIVHDLSEPVVVQYARLYVNDWTGDSQILNLDIIGKPVRHDIVFLHPHAFNASLDNDADKRFADYMLEQLHTFGSVFSEYDMHLGRSPDLELKDEASMTRRVVIILSRNILCGNSHNPRSDRGDMEEVEYQALYDAHGEQAELLHPNYSNGVDSGTSRCHHQAIRPHNAYINFIRGILQKHVSKTIVVFRDNMRAKDWRLFQSLERGEGSDKLENNHFAFQVGIKSCHMNITWPESKFFEEDIDDVNFDDSCRSVKQFWRRIELAILR